MGIVSFSTGYGGLLAVRPPRAAVHSRRDVAWRVDEGAGLQRLTAALSWPVDNAGIAQCRASADRVLSLYEDMDRLDADVHAPNAHRIVLGQSDDRRLQIEDLCIADPSGLILAEHIDAVVRRGERVLITGDSTVTNSLFISTGPWVAGACCCRRTPTACAAATVPAEGTLRRALCYPRPADAFGDATICHALECAGVEWLVPRPMSTATGNRYQRARSSNWICARAMQRPAWLLMEEATDAFDLKGERQILELLHRELPDTTLLTISSHPGLSRYTSARSC
jgi:putative ATP-binding cassette transporter